MVTITKDYIQLGIVVLMFLVFIYWDIKNTGLLNGKSTEE